MHIYICIYIYIQRERERAAHGTLNIPRKCLAPPSNDIMYYTTTIHNI